MATIDYLRFVGSLFVVLGLIGAGTWLFRRFLGSAAGPGLYRNRRLRMIESLPLDARHRLVLVRRDDVEHLIVIGQTGQVVVEPAIRPVVQPPAPTEDPRS
jgi:flagellar protein FliO/FliZ